MASTPINCICSVCSSEMDYRYRYGRDGCTCSRECFQEFDWRRCLSIIGEQYKPDPKRVAKAVEKTTND